jgi:ABC-type transport system involved in multi-copper enzyme maturation permease subunit
MPMAVRDRAWRRWSGTPGRVGTRPWVIARFALIRAFDSKLFLAMLVITTLPSMVALLAIWFSHNTELLPFQELAAWLARLPEWVFPNLFGWQAVAAAAVIVVAGPRLIVRDLTHHGLDLILARPITPRGYVLGKLAALALLTAPVSWLSGVLVVAVHAVLGDRGAWGEGFRLGLAYLVGHAVWLVMIALLTLAVSAWIRQGPMARILLLALFFLSSALGAALNAATGSAIGDLINPLLAADSVVQALFGQPTHSRLPVWLNWLTLLGTAAGSWVLLSRRISWQGSRE